MKDSYFLVSKNVVWSFSVYDLFIVIFHLRWYINKPSIQRCARTTVTHSSSSYKTTANFNKKNDFFGIFTHYLSFIKNNVHEFVKMLLLIHFEGPSRTRRRWRWYYLWVEKLLFSVVVCRIINSLKVKVIKPKMVKYDVETTRKEMRIKKMLNNMMMMMIVVNSH